jgi:hypothetical protein
MPPATRTEMKRIVKESGFMIGVSRVGGMGFGGLLDECRDGGGW